MLLYCFSHMFCRLTSFIFPKPAAEPNLEMVETDDMYERSQTLSCSVSDVWGSIKHCMNPVDISRDPVFFLFCIFNCLFWKPVDELYFFRIYPVLISITSVFYGENLVLPLSFLRDVPVICFWPPQFPDPFPLFLSLQLLYSDFLFTGQCSYLIITL